MSTAYRLYGIVLLVLLASVLTRDVAAQVIVTINMPPPYSPVLSDYRSDPTRVIITLTNTTSNSYRIRLSGYAENTGGGARIDTRDDASVPAITLGGLQTRTLSGRDLSLFDPSAVRFTGTDALTIQRTGRLPEGTYEVCIRALNYDNIAEVLSGPTPACAVFTVIYYDPPRVLQPVCESIIETVSPQTINFTWSQTTPPLTNVNYLFTIVEVPSGRDPYEAFRTRTAPPFFERTLSNQTTFTYSVTEPAMQLGRVYAWRVKAIDPILSAVIRNNGESEVCTFTFGRSTSSTGTGALSRLEAVYPSNGDVIPWLPPHLVVRFGDYSDEITRMEYTLTVRGSDGSTYTTRRTLNWPEGPRRGQGWPDASYNERSRYIIVNQEASSGGPTPSPWASSLRRGVTYTWSVNANFTYQGRTVNLSSPEQTFSIGATQPELLSPTDRAQFVPADQPITLRWRNPLPIQLNPPDLSGVRAGASSMFFGASNEQWRLELSRDSNFTTRDTNVTGRIAEYHTGDAAADLYATRGLILGRRDTGRYFWRVSWLQPDGVSYSMSPVWSFSIGTRRDTSLVTDTTRRSTPGACRDDCSAPAVANRTASTRSYIAGDVINVGRFQMRITTASGSGSSLSGEGTIQVNFLRAPIMVEFSGIRVNTDNTMFDGTIRAKIATEAGVSSEIANALTGAGLTGDQVTTLSTLASQTARLVTTLTSTTPVSLPIGFNNLIDGEQFVIGIIGMVFSPTQAKLNAAMSFPMPDLGPSVGLSLGARDICFHSVGLGGNGEATLYLVSDLGYRQPDTWGFVFKAPTSSDSGTYVSFDCNGFKELRLSALCEFPRTWFLPQPDDGRSLVTASFRTTIRRNGDWIAAASMDRCAIAGAPGFIMEIREIAYDHSNVRNPAGISFPTGFTGDRTTAWQGFYIGRASISLPDELRTFDESRPPQIAVTNLMIGGGGFTAAFRAENVIRYPQGNFGEWGASIDTISIDIVSSSLRSGSLMGEIKIPISDSGIYYRCTLGRPTTGSGLGYEFVVQPRDTIGASLWAARFYLAPTSRIELGNMSGTFRASATLTGGISISGDVGGIQGLSFNGIHFENFRVQSTAPYIDRGTWSFASENHGMAGFPLSISNLNIVAGDRGGRPGAGIQFTISLNLQSGSNAISGGTTLSIWGRMGAPGGPQSFEFAGIDLDSVGIRADMGIVEISGSLVIYNTHPTFGDGFRGAIRANFLRQVIVEATVQFGNVRSFRYWYVDANATFSAAIPVFTGVGIYGFGGGAWYHMRREGAEPPVPNVATASTTVDRSTTPGRTSSGYQFVPDNATAFGFRAKIVIGTMPSSEGFNGDIAIGATFMETGGVGEIFLEGAGYMMASVTNRSEAKITANVDIRYNFPTQVFHGVFLVNINASPFTGGGQMVIHAEPSTWYIKIGEPVPASARVNLNLGTWLRIDAYVMAGMNLPGPPPLPDEITRILGPLPVVRNAALEQGNGFAFGASARISTGRQQFLIFYGMATLGVGFDISLLEFGPDATCEGMPGVIGVNGWYAMGQMYAYIQASIGLYVDLLFASGEFEILGISAAAAIQAGAPNPTWIVAAVGGEYRILGGAISGRCHFDFKMGTECRPVLESPLARLDLISDMQPVDGARDVDVFVEPQVAFNLTVNEPFDLTEIASDGAERVRTFRVKIRDYYLQNTGSGARVPGTWALNADKNVVTFAARDVLSGRTQYLQHIAAYGEENISGSWRQATRRDGTAIDQVVEARFTTGVAPDDIPERNAAYSYPLKRQRYFLKGECPVGELKLKRGQPELFQAAPGKRVTVTARFIPTMTASSGTSTEGVLESTVRYNSSAAMLQYDMPAILSNTSYAIQFVRREESEDEIRRRREWESNPLSRLRIEAPGDQYFMTVRSMYARRGSTLMQTRRQLPGATARAGERLLYYYHFKSSQYSTLRDKMASMESMTAQRLPPLGNYEILRPKFSFTENVDLYDVEGYSYTIGGVDYRVGPLIRPSAYTRTAEWHRRFTEPYIYNAINRIRRTWGYPLVTEWDRYTRSSHLQLAEWHSRGEGPMRDEEMLPPEPGGFRFTTLGFRSSMLGTGSGFGLSGVGMSSAGTLAEAPSLRFNFNHGIPVPTDFGRVRSRAAYLYGFYCCEFLSPDEITFLRSIIDKRYEMLSRGNYDLGFTYGYCQSPDDPRMVLKSFRY